MKKDDKITIICKMVRQIIDEDKLADEAEIRRILEEKGKKEEEDRGICLASVIENELEKAIQSGQICEEHVGLYKSIFEKMIRESEIGNMPAKELSDILIKKFVLQAGKVYERDRTRLKCFTGMLQTGLNKMAEEDMLRFVPDRHIYRNYLIYPDKEIHYIDNPYTDAETEKIKEWIDLHTNDIRGLALGLWFTGNATLLEIVNLKKEAMIALH